MSELVKPFDEKMAKSINNLENDLGTIRAGRANPRVLDRITIDYYGVPTPLNQVGNISVPEARVIVIQPWESNILKDVEKALQSSDLGINPSNDGKVIRLVFPELTEERRLSLTKEVRKKGEDCKIAIRNIRRDAIDSFRKMEKTSEISEDDLKDLEEEIQKSTDKKITEIEKVIEQKNNEIMSI